MEKFIIVEDLLVLVIYFIIQAIGLNKYLFTCVNKT